jgi:hypothetical protein
MRIITTHRKMYTRDFERSGHVSREKKETEKEPHQRAAKNNRTLLRPALPPPYSFLHLSLSRWNLCKVAGDGSREWRESKVQISTNAIVCLRECISAMRRSSS